MQPIIYDVAVSADGFIAGAGDDVSAFPSEGAVVDAYLERLKGYACALMGRRTYEFGYRHGLQAGANPYPWMRCVILSRTIELPADCAVEVVRETTPQTIEAIRRASQGPVYLCGGGLLAGWMREHGLIDRLRLKRAPVLLGTGIPLFGRSTRAMTGPPRRSMLHEGGALYQSFDLT